MAWAQRCPGDPLKQLRLYQQSLTHDPENENAWAALVRLAQGGSTGAEPARAYLHSFQVSDAPPAMLYAALGSDAWNRGEAGKARECLSKAHQLDPEVPDVVNNLAWVLATSNPKDLPRALELINQAIAQSPKNASYRDTRGCILAEMGRWKDALLDLETALAAFPKKQDIHVRLAEVYRQLGMKTMAEEHHRLARSVSDSAQSPPAVP